MPSSSSSPSKAEYGGETGLIDPREETDNVREYGDGMESVGEGGGEGDMGMAGSIIFATTSRRREVR